MIARVSARASERFEPIDDVRATADYRRSTIGPLVGRALRALRDGEHLSRWPAHPPGLAAQRVPATPSADTIDPDTPISVRVNGRTITGTGATSVTLLDWLRNNPGVDGLSLDGTKEGCAEGECGACTVRMNGAAVMSCLVVRRPGRRGLDRDRRRACRRRLPAPDSACIRR